MRALVFLALGLLSFGELQAAEDLFLEDLKLLSAQIDEYKVENVPVEEALMRMFEKAGVDGVPVSFVDDEGREIDPASLGDVSLNLRDARAGEIIEYIAELKSCRTKFWGRPGVPVLSFIKTSFGDDTSSFYHSMWMECPVEAAKVLGLKPGMDQLAVRKVFERYGAEFGRKAAVVWNEKSGLLAVRGETTGMIPAMVKLAAKGHLRPLGEAR